IRRGRRLKAHLADCALCTAFAAAIPARRAGMGALFPPLGAALAAETLAAATGGGAAGAGVGHGAAATTEGASKGQVAAAITAATAAVLVGAMALSSSESDPVDPATPAKASPAPADPAKTPKSSAPPATEPASAARPPAAVAGYSDLGPDVLGNLGGTSAVTDETAANRAGDDGGSLPFSGLDLTLLALAGAALLGVGVGMRRMARAPRL
ncbi:MAG TPA: hypothetical protein VEX11_11890, partial [Acetobacteraceae bacterium]|nr:hypothetical protein [Acetobacteraceae bacterium]